MYQATTRNIEVTVTPRFLDERSSPANNYYFWAYTIEIRNRGAETVQLTDRHWRITDALRSEEHTSELQSPVHLVCRLLLEKKKTKTTMLALVRQPPPSTPDRTQSGV